MFQMWLKMHCPFMKDSPVSEEIIDLRRRVTETIDAIHENCYYIPIWEMVKHDRPIHEIDTKEELLEPFQDMWNRLPDSMAIRRYPFGAICDLAEEYTFSEE